jgi:hypothetical protein
MADAEHLHVRRVLLGACRVLVGGAQRVGRQLLARPAAATAERQPGQRHGGGHDLEKVAPRAREDLVRVVARELLTHLLLHLLALREVLEAAPVRAALKLGAHL